MRAHTTLPAIADDSSVHARIMSVVSPLGGLIEQAKPLPNPPGAPKYEVFCADLGDVRALDNEWLPGTRSARGQLSGAGTGTEPCLAERLAVVEAIERYCSTVFDDRQFLRATAIELGDEALDLDTVPRCSASELADPRCPVTAPDKRSVIRWVRGVSLIGRRLLWVPAVMAFMDIAIASPAERFSLQISTGCAAHVDLCSALVNAICEVVERDAIAMTWLQRLPLPRIVGEIHDHVGDGTHRASAGDVVTYLFDATTDVGLPTVYSVDVTQANRGFRTAVACATSLDADRAAHKVLREAASGRIALSTPREVTRDVRDFTEVWEGATYMGRPERQDAFAFLLKGSSRRALADLPSIGTGSSAGDLVAALERLAAIGLEAVAIDLTTDEARRAGIRAVKVIIPGLMPLSFVHRARYLGHPRLFHGPARMGYPTATEDGLNPWPQPFA